jgi:hypothetical protein
MDLSYWYPRAILQFARSCDFVEYLGAGYVSLTDVFVYDLLENERMEENQLRCFWLFLLCMMPLKTDNNTVIILL